VDLHEALLYGLLHELGEEIRLPGPNHTRANYRPHVTHRVRRLQPGDTFQVRQVALVDMFPDRDRRFRRVLEVWPLAEQEDGEQHGRQGQHGAEEGDVPGQG
jgi:hypothetical protein